MKKMCFFISVLAAVLCSLSTFAATAENSRPFVIPELKTWEAGKGDLTISGTMRIAVPSGDEELLRIAGMLAEDWNTVAGFRPEIVTEKGGKGDIVLEIKADKKLNKLSGGSTGSYSLDITDRVRLSASTARGVYWGTQTCCRWRTVPCRLTLRPEALNWPAAGSSTGPTTASAAS